MIDDWAHVIRWLHLLAAMVWVGGFIFIPVVLLPVVRSSMPPVERALLVTSVGQRFATVSWVALSVLVVTGVLNTERRRVDWSNLLESEYGRTLHWKLALVGIVIVLTLVHALYFGRRLARMAERMRDAGGADDEIMRSYRRLQIWSGLLSAVNLFLNLAIVLLAASLIA